MLWKCWSSEARTFEQSLPIPSCTFSDFLKPRILRRFGGPHFKIRDDIMKALRARLKASAGCGAVIFIVLNTNCTLFVFEWCLVKKIYPSNVWKRAPLQYIWQEYRLANAGYTNCCFSWFFILVSRSIPSKTFGSRMRFIHKSVPVKDRFAVTGRFTWLTVPQSIRVSSVNAWEWNFDSSWRIR